MEYFYNKPKTIKGKGKKKIVLGNVIKMLTVCRHEFETELIHATISR